MAWRQAYGGWFELVHVYAHTDKQDRISLGYHGADRLAVAGAEQKGTVATALSVVEPGAPAGSELNTRRALASVRPFRRVQPLTPPPPKKKRTNCESRALSIPSSGVTPASGGLRVLDPRFV